MENVCNSYCRIKAAGKDSWGLETVHGLEKVGMYWGLYGAGRNGFDAGKSPFEGHWKGWALKIHAFLGPEMAMSKASAIWYEVNLLCPARSPPPIQPFVQNN